MDKTARIVQEFSLPRLVTAAIAVAGLIAVVLMCLIFLDLGGRAGIATGILLAYFGLAAIAVSAVCVFLWIFLEGRVFRPLLHLLRQGVTADGPGRGWKRRLDAGRAGLEPIAGEVDRLHKDLASARRQTAETVRQAVAEGEGQRHRLESILRDLSEGVLVCNLEHQVLLYNRSALWLLSGAGEMGIGRPLEGILDPAPVQEALYVLLESQRESASGEGYAGTVSLACIVSEEGHSLPARMTLTFDGEGLPDGYVLTLETRADPDRDFTPPVLSEFYDFGLFSRPLAAPTKAEAQLSGLSYVVFDLETTGLSPSEGDRIVSIAGVRVVKGRVLRSEVFHSFVNPGCPISISAIRVHGITDGAVVDAPVMEDVLPRFRQFVGESILVAHNAGFDMNFLNMEEGNAGVRFDMPVLDTMLLSMAIHVDADGHGLDVVGDRFGVEIPPGERHTALGDTLATAEVFVRQLGFLKARGLQTLADLNDLSQKQAKTQRFEPS